MHFSVVKRLVSKALKSEVSASLKILTAMADLPSSGIPNVLSDSVTFVDGERLNKISVYGLRVFIVEFRYEETARVMAEVS